MTTTKRKRPQHNRAIVAVVVVAVVGALGFIAINFFGLGTRQVDINYDIIPVTRDENGTFVLGNPEAPFTLVVFEDYLCPACQAYEPTIKQYIKEFVQTGRARFEFRNLQTASGTDTIFRVAQCAGEQQPERFFEFREFLFEMTARGGWNDRTSPRQFAEALGLNYTAILACTAGANQVNDDLRLAKQAGVTGTPFLLYRNADGDLLPLPLGHAPNFSQLRAFVESQLASS